MPRSKSFCASGLHDVSKCTLPSLLSSVCPRADRASEAPVATMAAAANDVLFMIQLLVGMKPNAVRSSIGLKERASLPNPTIRYAGEANVVFVTLILSQWQPV